MDYDNPNPNIGYNTAMREQFLVSARPHDHHAHSYHSVDCKQGQFQTEGGGASIDYGHLQDITPIQHIDDSDLQYSPTTSIPITSAMSCGPISANSLLADEMMKRRRISAQEKIYYGTHLPNNLFTPNSSSGNPYKQYNYYGNQIPSGGYPVQEQYSKMKQGPFYRQNNVIEGYVNVPSEGFHGEWGRGLYDSGLAGRHFVTTQRMKQHPTNSVDARQHHEIRTEWTMKGNNGMIYPGDGVCQQPYKFWGDGYKGRYAYMPSGYEYNSYPHPYDNGSREKYGTYVTDYETGTNTAHGPIIAQQLTGPLVDKNRIDLPGEFRTIHMPGSMKERQLMQNAFANTRSPGNVGSNPVRAMYKTEPQGVLQTNIAIFTEFI